MTISKHASGREGRRKVPHSLASKNGIRKQRVEKLEQQRVLHILAF